MLYTEFHIGANPSYSVSDSRQTLSITSIFWDLGGVLLTNAWDHTERDQALAQFNIDPAEFNPRHQELVEGFEDGKVSLDDYLEHTIFYQPRTFSREELKQHIFSLSKSFPDRIQLVRDIVKSGKYLMGTINNESRELDIYRIETFGLRSIFSVFVSSCFVGMRKPDEAIYRCTLELTQKSPEECCFIDDRKENLVVPAKLGMRVIQAQTTQQMKDDLQKIGVAF
jgi:putative hydrolase of the HAD superfamily